MFPYETSLVSAVEVEDETHCALTYDPDPVRWPWLQLPCWHPVVAEKYSYFSSVSAGIATGLISDSSFTALTGMDWEYLGDPNGARYPAKARMESVSDTRQAAFSVAAEGPDGSVLFRMNGKGVVFRNRDFQAWRAMRKSSAPAPDAHSRPFTPAPAALAGCDRQEAVLVARPTTEDAIICQARVATDAGFHPGHPYHTGSRDHANAAHLLDAAYQSAHAILAETGTRAANGEALLCIGGRARFSNYVELDRNFELLLTANDEENTGSGTCRTLGFDVAQGGEPCARLSLRLRD